MHVNDLAFERNKNNLKTKNIFFPIFRVDHVRLSNEYFFASCALEQQYTYVIRTQSDFQLFGCSDTNKE